MEMYQTYFVIWVSLFSSCWFSQFNNDVKFINQFSPELSSSTEDDSVIFTRFSSVQWVLMLQVSDWVLNHLRVQLEEQGERFLPICLEERDWIPGSPILDSLTQSIQHSRKTVFILTERYVNSGSFKLAIFWLTRGFWRRTRTWLCCCCWSPCCSTHTFCGCADGSAGAAFSSGRIRRLPRPGSGSRCATPYEWTTRPFTATSTADISPLSRRNWRSISCFELQKQN